MFHILIIGVQAVDCNVYSPLQDRLIELEKSHDKCEPFKVAKGTFYSHMRRNKRDNNSYIEIDKGFSSL